MTTVVNNPTPAVESGGTSLLIGVILVIGFVMIGIYFGVPILRRLGSTQGNSPGPSIVIPDKIQVNVTQQNK